jgi:hypothetical protein
MEIAFDSADYPEVFGEMESKPVNLRLATPDRRALLNATSRHPRKGIFNIFSIRSDEMV